MPLLDALTLGPSRRRRRMHRQLRALDALYATAGRDDYGLLLPPPHAPTPGVGGGLPASYPRPRGRGPGRAIGVGAVVTFVIVLAMIAVPSLTPAPVARLFGLDRASTQPDTGRYAFLAMENPSSPLPVSYDPCRPLRVVMNPDGAPRNAEQIVRSAVEEVSRVSGLRMTWAGETGQLPQWTSETGLVSGRADQVVISFATPAQEPELAGKIVGLGSSSTVVNGRERYVSGGVTLDSGDWPGLIADGGVAAARVVTMHELGHVLGLAHVHDTGEAMNNGYVGQSDLGNGDRAGLAILGHQSCG